MISYAMPLQTSALSPWRLQAEQTFHQNRTLLRETIQRAKAKKNLTPEVVAAYAALHLTDDAGMPITPAAHHWLWLRLICDTRIKRLMIVAPPESAKTTWTLSAYVGCYAGFFPENSTIIGSTSGPVAEKRSLAIRTQVESAAWQLTFPGVLPVTADRGLRWSSLEWSLAPDGQPHPGRLHPSVSAYGTGGSVIGSRADQVIADDLLDYDNTRTQYQRELVETWFHNSLLSRRKARTGRVLIIGTAWHHADLMSKIKREGQWVICHMPLLQEGREFYATITYPDDWPYETMGKPIGQASLN